MTLQWAEATARYADRIRVAESLVHHLNELAHFEGTRVPQRMLKELEELLAPLRRQRQRIERGEFRVAVVGLEKAGKSTFVNAWLRCDLLPSAQRRCTFTTTQVHSCSAGEERVEVSVKSHEELEGIRRDLRTRPSDKGAQEDLRNVEAHWDDLVEVVRRGDRRVTFTQLEEIRDLLHSYVAEPRTAYAVREVRVFTSSLVRTSGVVFFDVPGLNSGMARHMEESRSMLEDCDAVICIQNARKPSLEAHEKQLVQFVQEGDREVGAGGKVFVFAGQIDLVLNREPMERNLQEIRDQWAAFGLAPDRVVAGSAAAYLLLTSTAGNVVVESTADRSSTVQTLQRLAPDREPLETCGVDRMRELVERYVREDRVKALALRCEEPLRKIITLVREEHRRVAAMFPEDPVAAQRQEEEAQRIAFNEWWAREWREIQAFTNVTFEAALDAAGGDAADLHSRFREIVDQRFAEIPSMDPAARQREFDAARYPAFDAQKTGTQWRQRIYNDVIQVVEERLACDLSDEIDVELRQLAARLQDRLWGAAAVSARLMPDTGASRTAAEVSVGLRTLFKRFARPVARALLLGPVGSDTRANIVKKVGPDIEMLDNYYVGGDDALRTLKKFAKYGRALLEDPHVREVVLGVLPEGVAAVARVASNVEVGPLRAVSEGDIVREVDADLYALKAYLADAIFYAAALVEFRAQEIERLRDRFLQADGTWAGVVQNEHASGNGALLATLPPGVTARGFDVHIADRVQQLRLALEGARS